MKIALINGSPKPNKSMSNYLICELEKLIKTDHELRTFNIKNVSEHQEAYHTIADCDVLVFSFPLYVDAIPSHLLYFLEELQTHLACVQNKRITVYAMVSCGFFEGRQTRLALQMIEHWCAKTALTWGQGIGTGGGEMLSSIESVPIGYGPKKSLGKAINALSKNIRSCSSGDTILTSPNFPRFIYILSAHIFWNSQAKANGLKKSDLRKKCEEFYLRP